LRNIGQDTLELINFVRMVKRMPAIAKARASLVLENFRAFEGRVSVLVACLLGSGGDGIIVAGL